MKHWHGTFEEYRKTISTAFEDAFVGAVHQYDVNVVGLGPFVTHIVVGNDNVGWAVIENTENVDKDKDSVMTFVQSRILEIEDMLEPSLEER